MIIASAFSAEVVLPETLKKEASGYIRKPFQWQDMLLKVRETLDRPIG